MHQSCFVWTLGFIANILYHRQIASCPVAPPTGRAFTIAFHKIIKTGDIIYRRVHGYRIRESASFAYDPLPKRCYSTQQALHTLKWAAGVRIATLHFGLKRQKSRLHSHILKAYGKDDNKTKTVQIWWWWFLGIHNCDISIKIKSIHSKNNTWTQFSYIWKRDGNASWPWLVKAWKWDYYVLAMT